MITKTANEVLEDLGFRDSSKAIIKATQRSDKGLGRFIADDKLVGARQRKSLKSALKGGLYGAASGALAGAATTRNPTGALAGTAIGGYLGTTFGGLKGSYDADKEYLGKRGIRYRRDFPHNLIGTVSVTPEAKTKYLPEYK